MENLHPDILESLQEYDLEDILDALLKLHDPREVLTAIAAASMTSHSDAACPWEVKSSKALADTVLAAYQPLQS
ncbi:MAG: hypothetical protein AAF528_02135 [Cyanobacteria bacterium P01_C01_bin.121]